MRRPQPQPSGIDLAEPIDDERRNFGDRTGRGLTNVGRRGYAVDPTILTGAMLASVVNPVVRETIQRPE